MMKIKRSNVDGLDLLMVYSKDIIIGIPEDIGPRILYAATKEKPDFNVFGILPEVNVETSEGLWNIYGGHRLWSSPEATPRSYSLDCKPVKIEINEDSINIFCNHEPENSVQKNIKINVLPEGGLKVVHTIENTGRWPIKLGCWALSVMRKNGFAILPFKSLNRENELLPDRHMTIWPYTDLSDERAIFADEYVFVKQDSEKSKPFKIGIMANPDWTAYWVDGVVFVKEFCALEGRYPDFGCNVEAYTNDKLLELETLSPMKTLDPNECISHAEIWKIRNIGSLKPDSDDVKNKLLDKVILDN